MCGRRQDRAGGHNCKLSLDIGISLARRFVMLHAVRAETPLKEIDNAAMLKLASLDLKQIVRECEEPEPCISQLAQRAWNLGVRRHGGKFFRELFVVLSSILMPRVSASIFITAEPILVNGT